jgi:hypothetical protein
MISSTTSSFFAQLGDQVNGGGAANTRGSVSEQFASALRSTLEDHGLSPDNIRVDVKETSSGAEEIVETFGSEPAMATSPRFETGDWKQMLDGNLTSEMLQQSSDPAGLLNARLESVRGASTAIVSNAMDNSAQPLNASFLSTRDQADAMFEKLKSFGVEAIEIEELQMNAGPFSIQYGDDQRSYQIAGMNVKLLLERYAKYPVEVADQMTMDELNSMA